MTVTPVIHLFTVLNSHLYRQTRAILKVSPSSPSPFPSFVSLPSSCYPSSSASSPSSQVSHFLLICLCFMMMNKVICIYLSKRTSWTQVRQEMLTTWDRRQSVREQSNMLSLLNNNAIVSILKLGRNYSKVPSILTCFSQSHVLHVGSGAVPRDLVNYRRSGACECKIVGGGAAAGRSLTVALISIHVYSNTVHTK